MRHALILSCLMLVLFRAMASAGDPPQGNFSCTGQVLSVFSGHERMLSVVTDRGNVSVVNRAKDVQPVCGDIIALSGPLNDDPDIEVCEVFADSIRIIGHRPLPPTTALNWNQLTADGAFNDSFCSARGVVISVARDDIDVNWNWIAVRSPAGVLKVAATETEYPLAHLQTLLDAEVEVRGRFHRFESARYQSILQLFGVDGIRIVVPPRADPFDAPLVGRSQTLHRQIAEGVVMARQARRLFLKTDDGRFVTAALTDDTEILPDELVTVSGFVVRNQFSLGPEIIHALVRRQGRRPPDTHLLPETSFERLFTDVRGKQQINSEFHGKPVRVRGTVASTPGETEFSGSLHLRNGKYTLDVNVSNAELKQLGTIPENSQVEVTGICLIEFSAGRTSTIVPSFSRILILPRSPADCRILSLPPFWTPGKLSFVIGLLFAGLIGVIGWNKSLKVHAERRGHELAQERIAHTQAEIKIEERTRLAVELHDSLSQTITGIAFQVDSALAESDGRSSSIAATLGTARQMLASCRKELQCCLWDLRCRTFEERDLTEAVKKAVEPYVSRIKTQIRFNVPRNALSEMATHTILQIVRELVVNAIRHGKATDVKVAGELHGNVVTFSVRDNGVGFDPATVPGPLQGHFGLHGIRERLKAGNGSLKVESRPGHGARFSATLVVAPDKTT